MSAEHRTDPQPLAVESVNPAVRPAPTPPGQRILTIDILRGFALFGILLVNMDLFVHSYASVVAGTTLPENPIDVWAYRLILFFAFGKFYSIFSFLFGLGMMLQFQRTQARGGRFSRLWLRRMAILLVFGLIHAYFIWVGDILILYSFVGTAMLLWRKARPRTLLIWAAIALAVPLILTAALYGTFALGLATAGEAAMDAAAVGQQQRYAAMAATADQLYATGTYWQVTLQRANEMALVFGTYPFMLFNVAAAMLLGLYAGRRGIFDDIPAHLPFIRKAWLWGLIVGVSGNLISVYFIEHSARTTPSPELLLTLAGQTIGAPALAIFYMASLTLLVERTRWRVRLAPIAAMGRMALTNYLLQSVICTLLFYGYGFGLYGRTGVAVNVVLTTVIYGVQMLFSVWWLGRYRFGPMEWLWRTLTYGKRQPMRLPVS